MARLVARSLELLPGADADAYDALSDRDLRYLAGHAAEHEPLPVDDSHWAAEHRDRSPARRVLALLDAGERGDPVPEAWQ